MSAPGTSVSPASGVGGSMLKKPRRCLLLGVTIFLASWTLVRVGENPNWLHEVESQQVVRSGVNASSIISYSLLKNATTNSSGRAEQTENLEVQSSLPVSFQRDGQSDVVATSANPMQASYPIGYDFLFWRGKNRICDLIRNITGVEVLGTDQPNYVRTGDRPPLINLTLHCEDLMSNTGNWITTIYHIRLAAALGRVDFQFQCDSGMESVEWSMLPWLSGRYSAPPSLTKEWPYDFGWPEQGLVCSKLYAKLPLHHLAHEMQRDMRRIAVAMLGPRHFPTLALTEGVESLQKLLANRRQSKIEYPLKELEIDDAAIHFRCGDVFGGTDKDVYGLIKFREYVERIPKETTKSIGIYTQPFNVSLLRDADQEQVHDCEKLVHVLVDYLQQSYPNATITIRNTKDDTIPLTYARLTMAAQVITTMSTFGIFPSIGTFGEGYFQKSGRQNKFAHEIPSLLPNFHAMDGPILSSPAIRKSKWEDILNFLLENY